MHRFHNAKIVHLAIIGLTVYWSNTIRVFVIDVFSLTGMVRFCRKMTILVSKSNCTLKRFLVILLGLFSLGTTSLSQEIRLSNRFVIDMDLDAQDRVWIATEEGLNCFDGIETTAYMKRPDGLPVSHINSVLADSTEPLVWVAMQKGGLACLDQRTDRFTVYRAGDVPDSLSDNDLNHIEQAPDGAIWVSTFSKGLCKFNRQTGSFDRYNADTFSGMQDHSLHTFTFRGDQLILGGRSQHPVPDRPHAD